MFIQLTAKGQEVSPAEMQKVYIETLFWKACFYRMRLIIR